MRTLVTGGAGCLGASIVERLRAAGDAVLVLDNFATSAREALPPNGDGFSVAVGSVADKAFVDAAFDTFRPDRVVHAAASYKNPDDWAGDLAVNALGSIHVVEAARRAGVARFVNLQTALCYGRPDATPIPVNAPLRPFTSYGVSKVAGEAYVLMSGLNAVSLRIANVTGPRLSIGPIPTFYTRLKAGKACFCSETTRDFLDLEDFLSLLEGALAPDAPQGVFNVSTGEGRTVRDVYDAVARSLGIDAPEPASVPPGADDIAVVVLDPTATETAFGWRARVPFADSLRALIRWYDVNGVREIYSHVRPPT
jgi:UDP-glucose 4-epimerase